MIERRQRAESEERDAGPEGWREGDAAIQADLGAIRAKLERTPTFMGWMVLAVAYMTFISVVFGPFG